MKFDLQEAMNRVDRLIVEVDQALPRHGIRAITARCSYCVIGRRHVVGNCVVCGWGPSPMAIDNPMKIPPKFQRVWP